MDCFVVHPRNDDFAVGFIMHQKLRGDEPKPVPANGNNHRSLV